MLLYVALENIFFFSSKLSDKQINLFGGFDTYFAFEYISEQSAQRVHCFPGNKQTEKNNENILISYCLKNGIFNSYFSYS